MNRAILHVDMDAFYASVEQHDRPELTGQPVIVGGTGNRGVVSAASYAAREFGVHSAQPMAQARKRCPNGVFLGVRMARYKEVSREIFACFHEITDQVEGLSLDEAFLDVSDCRKLHGTPEAIARRIKARIKERTGLTASVGVAPNKFLAKLASDLDKPDGLVIVTEANKQAILDPLGVAHLWGIGKKARARLEARGLKTIRQLRSAAQTVLEDVLGNQCQHFLDLAQGIDAREVVPQREEKSISSEDTFASDTRDYEVLAKKLLHHADTVSRRLRAHGLKARTVTVKLKQADFILSTRRHTFAAATDHTNTLYREACQLLRDWLDEHPATRLRLIGLGTANFSAATDTQSELFASPAEDQGDQVDRLVDAVREKFGTDAVKRGRLV